MKASLINLSRLKMSRLPFVAFLAFASALTYITSSMVLQGETIGLANIAIAFVIPTVIIAMLNDAHRALYIFLIWLLFEDFARKYLGNNMAIYFAKDFLALVVYLSIFLAWRRKQIVGFRPPFLIPLLLLVWFGILQIFNPASPSIIFGLLGVKLFFYYMPLMMVGYGLITTEQHLRKFLVANLALFLLIAGLGIAQAILGPTFLNPSTLQDDIRELSTLYRWAPISGVSVYRPSSVFVSTGRYMDLLNMAWVLALGFLGYALLRYRHGRRLAFISVPFLAAGIILSTSRGAFVWGLINVTVATAAFLWGAPWRQREVMRVLRALVRVVIGVALAVAILLSLFPEAISGRLAVYSETLSPDSPTSELVHRTRDYPLQNFVGAFSYERWPYGYGIGTSSLGLQYVARIFGVKPLGVGVESGYGTLIVEMGIGGLVLWLVMASAVSFSAWRVTKKLRGTPWFPIGFAIFWYVILMLFLFLIGGIQSYQDFVLNAYMWLLLGVLFQLPRIKFSTELEVAERIATTPRRRWIV